MERGLGAVLLTDLRIYVSYEFAQRVLLNILTSCVTSRLSVATNLRNSSAKETEKAVSIKVRRLCPYRPGINRYLVWKTLLTLCKNSFNSTFSSYFALLFNFDKRWFMLNKWKQIIINWKRVLRFITVKSTFKKNNSRHSLYFRLVDAGLRVKIIE